jgi:hypothetical protein
MFVMYIIIMCNQTTGECGGFSNVYWEYDKHECYQKAANLNMENQTRGIQYSCHRGIWLAKDNDKTGPGAGN